MHRLALVSLLVLACAGCPGEAKHVDDKVTPAPEPPAPDAQPESPVPASPDPDAAAPQPTKAMTHEQAFAKAKPVFEKYCESCHTQDGVSVTEEALEHFDMTKYPFGGHHAHEIAATVKKALGVGGKATMPSGNPGAVTGDELKLVLAWAEAWEQAHAGKGDHDHDHGDHTH